MIRVNNLQRTWGDFSLHDITLDVSAGEYLVILGPTGCGKTLLLETVAGIHRHYNGSILLDGVDVADVPPYQRSIGFVYQKSMLFPNLTVSQNISFGMKMRRIKRSAQDETIERLSGLLRIRYLLNRDVTSLSGGEMQKVALARALAIEPKILLLDEPLSPLDQASKDALIEEIRVLHRQLGTTTLHVTHDHNIARKLADRIALLQQGTLMQVGKAEDVFRYPASDFAAEFVRAPNVIKGTARRKDEGHVRIESNGLSVTALSDLSGPVGTTIAPEDIYLYTSAPENNHSNVLQGRISRTESHSGVVMVELAVGANLLTAAVPSKDFPQLAGAAEGTIYAAFEPSACHVFPCFSVTANDRF